MYHRCLKILQIACLVYIGAASGNWNPGDIQDPDTLGVTGGYAADRGESRELHHSSFPFQYIWCSSVSGRHEDATLD